MASSTECEQIYRLKKIADALSRSAHDANIFNNKDRRELEELINDYFDEEKESIDGNDVSVETGVRNTCQPSETDESDTDSEEETPLVEATALETDIDINDETSLAPDSERLKVEMFDCKCQNRYASECYFHSLFFGLQLDQWTGDKNRLHRPVYL